MLHETISLSDIKSAYRRIRHEIVKTPCPESIPLSEITGSTVFCKLDNLQRTGSFKERGARNALLRLNQRHRKKGVVAASAGNHALGLAYHGGLLGIPVTVVMPEGAPLIKITTCKRLGAHVVIQGKDFNEANNEAEKIALSGPTYIHGFENSDVIAGQGTIGLEILSQVNSLDAIVCPVDGGGLIAGLSLAVKSINPKIKIIAVESIFTGQLTAAFKANKPILVPRRQTLADGLATLKLGKLPFEIMKSRIDQIIKVDEKWISLAILRMLELEKIVVEGAAAVPLAALMSGQISGLKGKRVALVVCGGNIDPQTLSRVIEKGLAHDGRITQFTATIKDKPGGLSELCTVIASCGANINQISHDRVFSGPNISEAKVLCTVETRDHAHGLLLKRLLTRSHFL
ncbi:MAG: threonine ammonia-lyase [Verrucomicrobia bacterium]|nr:MAG: threonine ammonia-lyase [Verrucomicrobiota bacterium]